ncbi:UNVERIFIED_CONTAM: hypothetical protein GTU68_034038 [Idotea baltica]|nr:hypothetical protein [Idotea baltica]
MNIELWWLGKTNVKELQSGISDYTARIQRFNRFAIRELPTGRAKRPGDQILADEQIILKNLDARDYVILLDELGEQYTSKGFAKFVDKVLTQPARKIIFIIGSAYGFGEGLRTRSNHMVALSAMTFTHDMVRLIFLEQLYRSFSISNNLPYHH